MSGFVICGKPQFSGEWVRLGDICNVRSGGTPKRSVSEYWDQGTIPWVKIGDISGKYIFTTEECISEVGLNSSAAKLFQPGTLLFSIFASIGAVGILTVPAATNQAIAGLEITSKMIDRDYLFYFLKSSEMGAKQSGRGVAQNNINLSILRDMKVPVPSLAEQSMIARKFERIDCQIDAANNQLSSLETLVKSRFIEMFGDCRLARQDQDWKRIGNIGEVLGGATPKTQVEEYWGGGLPWLTPAEIGDSINVNATSRTLTSEGVRSCSLSKLPAGTVLLSSRAPIGKVAIAGIDMYCNQGFKNIVCGDSVLPRYLYSLLKFNSDYLNSLGRGATFKEISKRIVEDIKIPVPAVELQLQFECLAQQVDKLRFMLLGNPSPTYRSRSFCCSTNSDNGGVILEAKDY